MPLNTAPLASPISLRGCYHEIVALVQDTPLRQARFVIAGACAVVSMLVFWLATGEGSPAHHYFLYHVAFPNLLAVLNLPAFVIGAVVSGNVHQPNESIAYMMIGVQWGAIGFIVAHFALSGESRGIQ